MRSGWRRDALVSLGVFVFLIVHAVRANTPDPGPGNRLLGFEYGEIAAALARGQGYANAFGVESGPTAVMPPLIPTLMAAVFKVLGVRTLASVWVLLTIKYLALACGLFFLLRLVDRAGFGRHRYWIIPLMALPAYFHRGWFFKIYMDLWIVQLLVTCMTLAFFSQLRGGGRGTFAGLCALAVVVPLTSPVLAFVFVMFEVGYGAWYVARGKRRAEVSGEDRRPRLGVGQVAALLVVFAASMGPWTLRNYRVFGRFIPIKSTLGLELGNSALDDDGLISAGDLARQLPGGIERLRHEITATGEMAFFDRYRAIFVEKMRKDPADMIGKIVRRARNAFLFTVDHFDLVPARVAPDELAPLKSAELITDYGGIVPPAWNCLRWPEGLVTKHLLGVPIRDPDGVIADWRRARSVLTEKESRPEATAASVIISLIPTIALLIVLISPFRRNPAVIAATAVYLLYLAPYVAVMHYVRFQLPLIPLQALFMLLCVVHLVDRRSPGLTAEPGLAHPAAAGSQTTGRTP